MKPLTVPASEAKMRFGKYFKSAQNGKPVIVKKKNDMKSIVMIDLDEFEDLMEIFAENQDDDLNQQIEEGYLEYKKGKCEKGIDGLFEIMNDTRKKEILKGKRPHRRKI